MDFLRSKASNFRNLLKPTTPEAEAMLNSYDDKELVPLITTHLLPLFLVGQLDVAVTKVLEHFPDLDASLTKRYLSCFCECVLKHNIP